MIIEIALGIVLAFLIISFLSEFIAFLLVIAVLSLVVITIVVAYYFSSITVPFVVVFGIIILHEIIDPDAKPFKMPQKMDKILDDFYYYFIRFFYGFTWILYFYYIGWLISRESVNTAFQWIFVLAFFVLLLMPLLQSFDVKSKIIEFIKNKNL